MSIINIATAVADQGILKRWGTYFSFWGVWVVPDIKASEINVIKISLV